MAVVAVILPGCSNVPGWFNGELVELATYGIAQVRLETVQGSSVSFPQDQPASLEVPLPESISGFNGTMRFWQLDEQIWSLRGSVSNNDGIFSADFTTQFRYPCVNRIGCHR